MRTRFLFGVFLVIPVLIFAQDVRENSSIYVEPVTLSEVMESSGFNLNIGAIVSDPEYGEGLQKSADVYGLKLDLFVSDDPELRETIAKSLISQNNTYIIMDALPDENLEILKMNAEASDIIFDKVIRISPKNSRSLFEEGFAALKKARASIVDRIPKYDQILPIAFPISPMPDDFFQPSKFPYPSPLVRVPRTNESLSASVHAHTSCNMVAQTGNMLHYTSNLDKNLLLMGMEGGNLSLYARPGAIEKSKISAVMTSWVLNIQKDKEAREILVENNGIESSLFHVGIHALEELYECLNKWKEKEIISGYRLLENQNLLLENWKGKNRILKPGMFLVANDHSLNGSAIIEGTDPYGALTIDFFSTQAFVQQLVEIKKENVRQRGSTPSGGILSASGATVGNYFGRPLTEVLEKVPQKESLVQPYILNIEGGFMAVTPQNGKTLPDTDASLEGFYLDLRGPLTSDQTIQLDTDKETSITFRRTIMNFDEVNYALNTLKTMGIISGWDYEGARGQGLYANIVLYDFLGKNRKFMSSLCIWPTDEIPDRPLVRFYVDGMQRLNFGFLSSKGWRQEFVEVPMRIPPVPRDIDLYSGISKLR
ncbi:hypothetical protein [Ascidiimonas aurantiaca]|uniref:hypothetical protein n=1 Tax=Ascidiimonas aurantiaca TaxID=1685432 RepID=UPI0030EF00CD